MYSMSAQWMEQYANSPSIVIKGPAIRGDSFLFTAYPQANGHTNYIATNLDGFVRFFCKVDGDENGYGGAVFNINMANGEKCSVKGPWSSRGGIMGRHLGTVIAEGALREDETGYLVSVSMLASKAIEIAQQSNFEHYLLIVENFKELTIVPSCSDKCVMTPGGKIKDGNVVSVIYEPAQ